jgi:hypothetical protein
LILFDAVVNGIQFCSLQLLRGKIDVYIWVLYPAALLNLFISLGFFVCLFFGAADWTQDLGHAKHMLRCHLHPSHLALMEFLCLYIP